jgi:hypothetical protein
MLTESDSAMIEPMQTASTRDEDMANYQPMAVLAVIAVLVSGLFMALVLILTIVGMVTRKAVLEPWLIAFAVIGVLLAIAARWQIRLSEGTRAGLKLANLAWWLAIIGGGVYLAYYAGSVMSIQAQARSFVKDIWLADLRDNKVDEAFLLTMEPIRRKGMNVRDIRTRFGSDVVAPFRAHSMVRTMSRAEGKVEIEPRGVAQWQQTLDGLEVTTQFVIRTPEGDFEYLIPVLGTDHKELEGRQWQIRAKKIAMRTLGTSDYGRWMKTLEMDSKEFLQEWIGTKLHPYRHGEMFLDTTQYPKALTREERRKMSQAFQTWTVLGNTLLSIGDPSRGLGNGAVLGGHLCASPNYADFYFQVAPDLSRKLIRWDETKQAQKEPIKEAWLTTILSPRNIEVKQLPGSEGLPTIEISSNEIRATLDIGVMTPPTPTVPPYRCRGTITAVVTDRTWVSKLNELKSTPWKGRAQIDDSPPTVAHFDWRVDVIVIDLARDTSDERPGGGTPLMPDAPPARGP